MSPIFNEGKTFLFMKYLTFLFVLLSFGSLAQLIPQEPRNVAIFLYDNVELLDFAGPGEVFSAAGFHTYTVSVDGKEITSQKFVKIKPEYSVNDAPLPDIIVFPGGNAGPTTENEAVIQWVKDQHGRRVQFMSVCTGAFILAKAGLLDKKRVTTHWGATGNLARKYPTTTVMENTRWIDNDFVITTAGVSAGIDGALHFVSRIKGLAAAQRTARYMEYDKWDFTNGVIDSQNEHLIALANSSPTARTGNAPAKAPFVGEYINLSNSLIVKGDYNHALKVTEAGIKVYPESEALYKILGTVNRKLGRPAPIEETELISMVHDGKVDKALQRFEQERKAFPKWKIYSEDEMKNAGYLLLEKKNYEGAIKIFKLNTQEFPKSGDAFDSLGEAYIAAGKRKEGIDTYKIAASMGYENSIKVLKQLQSE